MSSGVHWQFRITNADPAGLPFRYDVGLAWASGEPSSLAVSAVQTYRAVAGKLWSLPGLGGARRHWTTAEYDGPFVAAQAARSHSREQPVEAFLRRVAWPGDHAGFAEGAGVRLADSFREVWPKLADAADEYPRRWESEAVPWKLLRLEWGVESPASPEDHERVSRALAEWEKLDLRAVAVAHDRAITL